jgi:hypothetical protein
VEANHNCDTTLYAPSQDQEARFIKNKVMARLMVANVDKTNQIPHTDVISPTFEGDDVDDVWWVQSQHHLGAIYKIHAPFTEYASCTCEWAL